MFRLPDQQTALGFWQQVQSRSVRAISRVLLLSARQAPPPNLADAHLHEIPTLVGALDGQVRIAYAGGAIDLQPGEVLVIAPGAWHCHVPLRAGSLAWWQGINSFGSDVHLRDQENELYFAIPLEPSASMLRSLPAIADQVRRCVQATALLTQLLSETPRRDPRLPAQRRMAEHLWRHMHLPVTTTQILAASGLGIRQAHRLFVALYQDTPKRVLERARLALAEQYLREGFSVAEAARMSGYRDRAGLTRAWGRVHHLSPRQWLERLQA